MQPSKASYAFITLLSIVLLGIIGIVVYSSLNKSGQAPSELNTGSEIATLPSNLTSEPDWLIYSVREGGKLGSISFKYPSTWSIVENHSSDFLRNENISLQAGIESVDIVAPKGGKITVSGVLPGCTTDSQYKKYSCVKNRINVYTVSSDPGIQEVFDRLLSTMQ